ncbi:MAG: hypothetical protein NC342_01950 [Pseudoflavonifractor sp.]|nr:hypothetical protein [Alloprevotella sp.]MCM1116287.1 hypothetical protein [Pseudoflavonifractor sp.]
MAEAGLGRVNLQWDDLSEEIDGLAGYNPYRYTDGDEANPTRLSQKLIAADEAEWHDYEAPPRTAYNYYYRAVRTGAIFDSPEHNPAA